MNKWICAIVFVLITVLVAQFANATSASANITAKEDATVSLLHPDSNYGSDILRLNYGQNTSRMLLKFDLLEPVPYDAQITDARLYIYLTSSSDASSRKTNAYLTPDDSWTESTATWNNMPSYGETPDNSTQISSAGWYFFNVTNAAKNDWMLNTEFSFVVAYDNESQTIDNTATDTSKHFSSRESASNLPYLAVTYTSDLIIEITGVSNSSITNTSSTIRWNTNVNANSIIDFGLSQSEMTEQAFDSAEVTAHTVVLSSLAPNTTWCKTQGPYSFKTLTTYVPPPNHDPVLNPIGNKQITVNNHLAFTVLATDQDNDTLSYSASPLPSGATFANRAFSWTPNTAGNYSITFMVTDGQSQDNETITIEVVNAPPVNHAPVLAAIGSKTVNENQLLQFSISATDQDNDTLAYSAATLPTGAAFDAESKTFSWTPTYDQSGKYNVTFAVSDGTLTDSEKITITVNNVNRKPVLNQIGDKKVVINSTLSFTVSATDPDGNTITYSAKNLPTNATFASRIFTWKPKASDLGTHTVTFVASDGSLNDTQAVIIDVISTDYPLLLSPIGNKDVNENEPLQIILSATYNGTKTLAFTAENLPPNASFTSATKKFLWIPTYGQGGNVQNPTRIYNTTFTVSEIDGNLTYSETIIITVHNVNRAPFINTISPQGISEGDAVFFRLEGGDYDSDALTYSAGNLPAGSTFDPAGHVFLWMPSYTQKGIYNITFSISDDNITASTNALVTVLNVPIVGLVSDIKTTNVNQLIVKIDGLTEFGEPTGIKTVEIFDGTELLASFEINFDEDTLDFTSLEIEKQLANSTGYMIVKDLVLENTTKTMFIDKNVKTTTSVCIKDDEVSSISEVSSKCTAVNEKIVTCNNKTQGTYKCENLGTKLKVSGLKHSAVKEFTPAAKKSSSGGGGGGYYISSTPTPTPTITPTTTPTVSVITEFVGNYTELNATPAGEQNLTEPVEPISPITGNFLLNVKRALTPINIIVAALIVIIVISGYLMLSSKPAKKKQKPRKQKPRKRK